VGLDLPQLESPRRLDPLGGEAQRIRLATQIGAGLTASLHAREPRAIGLHQRDTTAARHTVQTSRLWGKHLIVGEHDETRRAADHLVDIGPGPGVHGGHIVGLRVRCRNLLEAEDSITVPISAVAARSPHRRKRARTRSRKLSLVQCAATT